MQSLQSLSSFIRNHLVMIAWLLTASVLVVGVSTWLAANPLGSFNLEGGAFLYRLFPVFGLIAFSVLWSQYVTLALGQATKAGFKALSRYFAVTAGIVTVALLSHPGLLVYQLWRDGFGLPPVSVLHHFVEPSLGWVALLGMISWFIFMTYGSLHTLLENRPWWRFVVYAGDFAMLAVFYHGLRLGDQLQGGWFRGVWLGYGSILIIVLIYMHRAGFRKLLRLGR